MATGQGKATVLIQEGAALLPATVLTAVVKDVEIPPALSSDATLAFLMDGRPIGTQVFVVRGQI